MADITVVIVSFNAEAYLRQCLESLDDAVRKDICRVVVVDNASTDNSMETVKKCFTHAELIESGTNLGFARANNLGLSQVTTPFVLFLNSDTTANTEALVAMQQAMEAEPVLQVCSCQQLDGLGRPHPINRFPSHRAEFMKATELYKIPVFRWISSTRSRIKMRKHRVRTSSTAVGDEACSQEPVIPADWVGGAVVMMRSEFAKSIKGWNEDYFFYGEDVDLCMRVKKLGQMVGVATNVSIVHYGGGSSNSIRPKLMRHYVAGNLLFFETHYGRRARISLQAIYSAGSLINLVKWFLVSVSKPQERASARDWIQLWLDVLLWKIGTGSKDVSAKE